MANTPNLDLTLIPSGTENWASTMNTNLTEIDTAVGSLKASVEAVTTSVPSVFGRSGAVTAQTGDYTFSEISGTVSPSQLQPIPMTSLTGILPVSQGGSGAGVPVDARANLGAAAEGANADITALSALTSLQLSGSQAVTTLQGSTGTALAVTSGTFTSGHLRSTDASGNEVDSGVAVTAVAAAQSTATAAQTAASAAQSTANGAQTTANTALTNASAAQTSANTAQSTATAAQTTANAAQPISAKGQPNGYASLDASGLLPSSQLPPLAIDHTYVVSSSSAMLALSANVGDVAVRTDLSETFILQALPATTSANWIQLLAPISGVTSVAGRTGAVTLTTTDIGGLGTAARANTTGSGAAVTTGPASSTTGDIAVFTGTAGQIADSGVTTAALGRLASANTWTAANNFQGTAAFGSASQTTINATGNLTTSGTINATGSSAQLELQAGSVFLFANSNGVAMGGAVDIEALTVATSSANASSSSLSFDAAVWNGSASTFDKWTISNTVGTGTNPSSTLLISHGGSGTTPTVSVPNLATGQLTSGAANANPFGSPTVLGYGFSQTDTGNRAGFVLQSNEASNPFGLYMAATGASTATARSMYMGTGQIGSANSGTLNIQTQPSSAVNVGNSSGGVTIANILTVNSSGMTLSGTFTATTKNFSIPYPGNPDDLLVHSCLEGPEVGVYYRGTAQLVNGTATVTLPEYFEALTLAAGRTVLLTPQFQATEPISQLAASMVANGQFTVRASDTNNPSQTFCWEVKAVRSDVPELEVVVPVPIA